MSHLKERKEKNCLNCNAEVSGKYCSVCGQENIEPAESAWHLVTHFFNDITHFDGKFFSSLKYLIFKPGFLSHEYKVGRRASYLNPVRMYVFTSFIFFLIFFSVYHFDKKLLNNQFSSATSSLVNNMDSSTFVHVIRNIDSTRKFTRPQFKKYLDSTSARSEISYRLLTSKIIQLMDTSDFNKFVNDLDEDRKLTKEEAVSYIDSTQVFTGIGSYRSKEQYDSALASGKASDGWVMQKLNYRKIELNAKYGGDSNKMQSDILSAFQHSFPQMLFVSLPLFALFLKLIYFRHKSFYYVSHAIFSIHLYIFVFIALLAIIGLNILEGHYSWGWIGYLIGFIYIWMFYYAYKAMRNFYGQGRVKTFLKFFLLNIYLTFIVILLFFIFLVFSFLKL